MTRPARLMHHVGDVMRLVLEFVRATDGGDPYGFRFGPQHYLQRSPGGTYQDITLDWDDRLLANLEALRTSDSAELEQRLGHHMRCLLPNWPALAAEITAASHDGHLVEVIIRSAAAEFYLLPWELLTVESGQYVGALPNVLVRYAWPKVATRRARTPDRVLFAWSAADKPVPRDNHAKVLRVACTKAGVAMDTLPYVSASSLSVALARARSAGRPFSALHILCHGIERNGAFELLWDRGDGPPARISADRLRDLLAAHADELNVVTLCACDSGNAGQPDSHLGSLARALHRIKIPAVIGSRYRLSKPGSVAFTEVFYRRLLADRAGVPAAFLDARRHLRESSDHAEPRDWMSVRLYAGTDEPAHESPPPRKASVLSTNVTRRRPRTPAAMLHARYQVVPFFEPCRRAELDALQAWLNSRPQAPSIRLFTGPGGSGKTRLFIEWCTRLRERGWDAGFLDAAVSGDRLDALLVSERDTFVVIDYSEMQPHLFATLHTMLAANSERFHVALIARHAGDWWQSLKQRDVELGDSLAEYQPLQLAPVLVQEEQRASAFAEACRAFANARGDQPDESWPVELGDRCFERMLYIHIAALAVIDGEQVPARNLLEHAVAREQQVWLRDLAGCTDRAVAAQAESATRLVAAVTLRGGAGSAEEARAIAECVDGPTGDFVRVLRDLYPGQGSSGYLGGLEPDLLGEALVARVLGDERTPLDYLTDVFADADQNALRTGFAVLGRIAIHQPEQAREWLAQMLDRDVAGRAEAAFEAALAVGEYSAFSPLGKVLSTSLERSGLSEIALAFDGRVPNQTVGLRELARWVDETLLGILPAHGNDATQEARIQLLNNLGHRYSTLGQTEKALKVTKEALKLCRVVSKDRPDAFRSPLAMSLHNLGDKYLKCGRPEQATIVTLEAIEHYRALVKAGRTDFLADLAKGLNNLAICYEKLGRPEKAEKVALEAHGHYRKLAQTRPKTFLPDVAMSLNNLATLHIQRGQLNKALKVILEAYEHYRQLATTHPDAFLPDLAGALNNLGSVLGLLGNTAKAIEALTQAVQIYFFLTKNHPEAFGREFASCVNNLSVHYSVSGKHEEALWAAQHTVMIRRVLANESPDADLPDLARGLNNLGNRFSELGRIREAMAATLEAVQIQRTLSKTRPGAFLPDLARFLNNLGIRYSEAGRYKEALSATREAIDIYCRLSPQHPVALAAKLQWCSNSLVDRLQQLGHDPDQDRDIRRARELIGNLLST